jgi:hypothetical protein
MATMRRTAATEKVAVVDKTQRPEVVVHDPVPKAQPEQRWTLTSYPFYERHDYRESAKDE